MSTDKPNNLAGMLAGKTAGPRTILSAEEALVKQTKHQPIPQEHVAPLGSFIALRLPCLILTSGAKVLPTFGYFAPKSQEEFDLLTYFDGLNQGLVERVGGPADADPE